MLMCLKNWKEKLVAENEAKYVIQSVVKERIGNSEVSDFKEQKEIEARSLEGISIG